MRTNIEIDDKLMAKALQIKNISTKKQAVEKGLELLVRLENQAKILNLWGKVELDDEAFK